MSKVILVKPLISEKSERLIEDHNQYTFVVTKRSNKIEIRKAVEEMYGVNVTSVSTSTLPGKTKVRYTKTGMSTGRKPVVKKAIVSLQDGDSIDYYEDV